MLASAFRLRRSADFAVVLRQGDRCSRPSVVVHLCVRAKEVSLAPQVGLVVGRAVGPAVRRNRLKRRLRHVLASRVDCLPRDSLLVIRALPAAAEASFAELGSDIDAALTALSSPSSP